MRLNFLGCGSGFTDSHNNAFFTTEENDIVFIDLSMLNIRKALKLINGKKDVYLLITHMHDDHVSGLTLFIQYLYYTLRNRILNIVIPEVLYIDVVDELRIKGISPYLYKILVYNPVLNQFVHPWDSVSWLNKIIPTEHVPELAGRCFGYDLNVLDTHIIYTGDTCRLSDFTPYLEEEGSEFYVDCSYDYGAVHLKWSDVECDLKELAMKHKVYLMHLDNQRAFQLVDLHGIHLVREYIGFTKEV